MEPLDIITLAAGRNGVSCGCGTILELDQPDSDAPEQLIGTCPDCGRSLLLYDREEHTSEFIALVLPTRQELLDRAAPAA